MVQMVPRDRHHHSAQSAQSAQSVLLAQMDPLIPMALKDQSVQLDLSGRRFR